MNITINYPGGAQAIGASTVHSMVDGMTRCKRRPVNYSASHKAVTCPECLKNMPAPLPQPKKRRRNLAPDVPRKDMPGFRLTRCWVLTPKGQALVDQWEREERP